MTDAPSNRNAIGGMQHVAFTVTASRFEDIERRLAEHGVPHSGAIPQMPGLLGIYFYDPNGLRLEFACQPEDGDMPGVIACSTQTKTQARAELESLDADARWVERMLTAMKA